MTMAVDKKLDMSLDDIVHERKQQSASPNDRASGKSRSNSKRSERIAHVGPYQSRAARGGDELDDGAAAGRRVYVGNLSWSVHSEHLKEHMSVAGNVLHAYVLESNGRSKGCGLVEYATEEDATQAIATLTDTELDGRKIFVREDRGTTREPLTSIERSTPGDENRAPNANGDVSTTRVYVGNLSWAVKWQNLKDHMKVAGTIKHADVLTEPNGRSKGCGLVEFETEDDAARAIELLNDTELEGRKIFVREDREPDGGSIASIAHRGAGRRGANGPRSTAPLGRLPMAPSAPAQPSGQANSTALYVGNLPWDVTWPVLKDLFHSVGEVEHTEIAHFPDGRSRGFGIVRFVHPADAQRAIQHFNGSEMNGRAIEVRYDKGRA